MSKLKYFLFLSIMFFSLNVFATETNVTTKIRTTPSGSTGQYKGLEIYNTGSNNTYNVNTRYNGQLSQITFYLNDSDFSFNTGTTYTITLNMATEDWRNHFMGPQVFRSNTDGSIPSSATNWYNTGTFQFISKKKIKFNFTPTGTLGVSTKFNIYSTNVSSTAFTGVSNWNLSSIIISDNVSSGGSSSGGSSGGNTYVFDDTGIINNNNKNTSDIIENNNSNTDTINNNINDNLNTCIQTLDSSVYKRGKFYSITGALLGDDDTYYTDKYIVSNGGTITVSNAGTSNVQGSWYIVWDKDGKYIDYYYARNRTTALPNNAYYVAFSSNNPNIVLTIDTGFCTNKLDGIGQRVIDGANSIIENSNINANNIISGVGNSIINGANDLIESQNNNLNTCFDYFTSEQLHRGKAINQNGNMFDSANWYYSDFYELLKGSIITITNGDSSFTQFNWIVLYDSNKQVFDYYGLTNRTINIPNNVKYVRLSTNNPNIKVQNNKGFCINKTDETNNKIDDTNKKLDDLNNSITDETQPTINLELNISSDTPISDLLLMPIHLIQTIYNNANNTCQPYTIPFDFTGGNNTLTFPCIDLEDYLGSTAYNIIDKILCFVIAYEIGLMCVTIFNDFTSLRDDFGGIYSPKHHDTSTRVGRGELEGKY